MVKLVLLRHGESVWNKENRFTGWTDVDLTEKGVEEARRSGKLLKDHGFNFDAAFTNLHKRAIRTLWIVLDEMNMMWLPVEKSWRLNERHYGALQGMNKSETAQKFGEGQVEIWRRSYAIRPPVLDQSDQRYTDICRTYPRVEQKYIPLAESLEDTIKRFLPYWDSSIAPLVRSDKRVLIVASHNSLRAIIKHIGDISDEAITKLTVPTGVPVVYELDGDMKTVNYYFLGDEKEISQRIQSVASQGKAK